MQNITSTLSNYYTIHFSFFKTWEIQENKINDSKSNKDENDTKKINHPQENFFLDPSFCQEIDSWTQQLQ